MVIHLLLLSHTFIIVTINPEGNPDERHARKAF